MSVLNILSHGGGVQTQAMCLMAEHGEITPKPDYAIMADTKNEPDHVYSDVKRLQECVSFPILVVSKGDLMKDHFAGGRVKIKIPVWLRNPDGTNGGLLGRQCTQDYKVWAVNRKIKELCGVKRGGATILAIKWIGISVDEAHRAKPSRQRYIQHRHPLLEKYIYRQQCVDWMLDNGYWEPKQSSCKNCPFHDNKLWHKIKTETPNDFTESVEFEKKLQIAALTDPSIKGTPYLHKEFKPLDEIDFESLVHTNQRDMFGEECEGLCGV